MHGRYAPMNDDKANRTWDFRIPTLCETWSLLEKEKSTICVMLSISILSRCSRRSCYKNFKANKQWQPNGWHLRALCGSSQCFTISCPLANSYCSQPQHCTNKFPSPPWIACEMGTWAATHEHKEQCTAALAQCCCASGYVTYAAY